MASNEKWIIYTSLISTYPQQISLFSGQLISRKYRQNNLFFFFSPPFIQQQEKQWKISHSDRYWEGIFTGKTRDMMPISISYTYINTSPGEHFINF